MAGLARVLLTSLAGAVATTAVAFGGWAALALLPGAPGNVLVRGAAAAAHRGPVQFLSYLYAPETAVLFSATTLWYDLIVLPLAVVAGSITAVRLCRGSVLTAALGSMVPAVILRLWGPLSGPGSLLRAAGILFVSVVAWGGSTALLRWWSGCSQLRRPEAGGEQ